MVYQARRVLTLSLIACSQAIMRIALVVCPAPDATEKARVLAAYDQATESGDVRDWTVFKTVVSEER